MLSRLVCLTSNILCSIRDDVIICDNGGTLILQCFVCVAQEQSLKLTKKETKIESAVLIIAVPVLQLAFQFGLHCHHKLAFFYLETQLDCSQICKM